MHNIWNIKAKKEEDEIKCEARKKVDESKEDKKWKKGEGETVVEEKEARKMRRKGIEIESLESRKIKTSGWPKKSK